MKKIFMLFGALALSTASFSQTQVEQGNFIIDPYVGIPNWANSILYSNYDGSESTVSNYKTVGGMFSYGGRLEYMVADNFGIGADVNYEVSGFQYDYMDSTYNSNTNTWTSAEYNDRYAAKKLRIMARFNYHFVQSDRVDAYAGFGGGYRTVNRSWTSTNPMFTDDETNVTLIPVAIRLAIGTRIYFTDNIGANLELGLGGGAILQFGISAKF